MSKYIDGLNEKYNNGDITLKEKARLLEEYENSDKKDKTNLESNITIESKLFKEGYFKSPMDLNGFKNKYDGLAELTKGDKEYLLQTRIYRAEQHLKRISNNVVFFFWITLINLICAFILVFYFMSNMPS